MFEPAYASASEIARAIREGRITAVETLDAQLERISRLNGEINAIITLDEHGARRRAREADSALLRGELWGPLHGVPITIFDWLATVGILTTQGGNPKFADWMPAEESTVVGRLRGAGAIVVGKTNDDHGFLGNANLFAPPNNPWDKSRAIGGDGGAAAAVAAGFSPIELGQDGGSAIGPAHYTGIYALRPTRHRVPRSNVYFDTPLYLWRSLISLAFMARTVDDLRLVLEIASGPDGIDTSVAPVPLAKAAPTEIAKLRVAWTSTLPGLLIDDEIRDGIERFATDLSRKGAVVERIYPQIDYRELLEVEESIFEGELSALGEDNGGPPGASLASHLRLMLRQDTISRAWDDFMKEWDALILPIAVVVAPPRAQSDRIVNGVPLNAAEREFSYVCARIASMSGLPAVIMPLGRNHEGMPFGVQVLGKRWEEMRLLAIVQELEALTGGFVRPPGY